MTAKIDNRVAGGEIRVPLLNGKQVVQINFDNAASTPALQPVWDGICEFIRWYSSIHRGSGFKSQLCTWAYERSREVICGFVGADIAERSVIFVKHTTDAINKLANRYPFQKGDVLITTIMEHHSNDLPWRDKVDVVRLRTDGKSPIDPADLEALLKEQAGRCKLVAVTGASNVTGILNPIYELAKVAHKHGARIFVDAAQLAPHRKIHMGNRGADDALDFLALSGHKMYAPFGTGALIGWPETFNRGKPDYVGGGAVKFVSEEEVLWKDGPERDEAGSPNVVGAVAMGLAAQALQRIGMDSVAEHEALLAHRLVDGLHKIDGLEFIGPSTYAKNFRVGVVAFNLRGMHHSKTAAILSCEFGIAVRNGCFCAQPYLKELLHFTTEESHMLMQKIRDDAEIELPGGVRASFGVYNTLDEVEAFLEALDKISRGEYQGTYEKTSNLGDYWPAGCNFDFQDYFNY